MSRLPRKSLSSGLKWVQFSRDREATHQRREPGLAFASDRSTAMDWVESDLYGSRATSRQQPHQVAIIMPVYNEQTCIGSTFDAVLEYCQSHPDYCFIFVSDGSSDLTQQILEQRIADAQTEQIQLLSYCDRGGKGHAVKMGVHLADADQVCFLDGDLAYSLDHLDRLVAKLTQYDVVIGCRSMMPEGNQGLRLSRKIAGKVFNALSKQILNLPYVDMQAGLKGFRGKAAKEIFDRQELIGFSFDVELIYLAKKLGYSIAEIPAYVSSSHATKPSKVNLLADSLKMLRDLFKIRWNDVTGSYE
ncbi:glycosyltransferase [Phormidium sp. CLA17]|uniref:glycosyltransferase n=1 Tax=Leptolyngbya sp. Cla-17 TaxID=2803751 RepID=UPI001492A85D|nr:glycosyltransferase [Leptolyngbya sp. Cla-17]MBM0740858.1 glycosyltransferase [Leptolyngbya sp. Cla-17]